MNESILEENVLIKYKKIYGEKFVLEFISKYKVEDLEFGLYIPDTFIHVFQNQKIKELCEEINFNPIKLVMLKLSTEDLNMIEENYKIIIKTIKSFHINNETLIKIILSSSFNCKSFCKFVTKINYHILEKNIQNIYNIYLNNKKYLDQIINYIDKESITIFLSINKLYNYNIENIDDISNVKQLRKRIILEQISNCQNIEEVKDEIINCYFNVEIDHLNTMINDIKNISTSYFIPRDLLEKLDFIFSLNFINCKEKLVDYVNKIDDYALVINECEKLTKEYASEDIAASLTIFKNTIDKIYLEGQSFKLLVHKIAGYTNSTFQKQLLDDITFWNKNYDEKSGVSTTLISNNNIGIVRGQYPIIGFNNVPPDSIIDMGIDDIYFNGIMEDRNYFARYMTADDLINNSRDLYNEVVIKRYSDLTAIKPNFTFSYDQVSKADIKISNYFKIPNYILNVDIYAKLMNDKMNHFLKSGDIINFTNAAFNLCISFCIFPEVMDLYLRSDQLCNYSYKFIKMYLEDKIDGKDEDIIMQLDYMLTKFKKILMIESINGYHNTLHFNGTIVMELKEKIKSKKHQTKIGRKLWM